MADGISAGPRNGLWWKGSDGQRWTVAPRGILPFQRCCAPLLGPHCVGCAGCRAQEEGIGSTDCRARERGFSVLCERAQVVFHLMSHKPRKLYDSATHAAPSITRLHAAVPHSPPPAAHASSAPSPSPQMPEQQPGAARSFVAARLRRFFFLFACGRAAGRGFCFALGSACGDSRSRRRGVPD